MLLTFASKSFTSSDISFLIFTLSNSPTNDITIVNKKTKILTLIWKFGIINFDFCKTSKLFNRQREKDLLLANNQVSTWCESFQPIQSQCMEIAAACADLFSRAASSLCSRYFLVWQNGLNKRNTKKSSAKKKSIRRRGEIC